MDFFILKHTIVIVIDMIVIILKNIISLFCYVLWVVRIFQLVSNRMTSSLLWQTDRRTVCTSYVGVGLSQCPNVPMSQCPNYTEYYWLKHWLKQWSAGSLLVRNIIYKFYFFQFLSILYDSTKNDKLNNPFFSLKYQEFVNR